MGIPGAAGISGQTRRDNTDWAGSGIPSHGLVRGRNWNQGSLLRGMHVRRSAVAVYNNIVVQLLMSPTNNCSHGMLSWSHSSKCTAWVNFNIWRETPNNFFNVFVSHLLGSDRSFWIYHVPPCPGPFAFSLSPRVSIDHYYYINATETMLSQNKLL